MENNTKGNKVVIAIVTLVIIIAVILLFVFFKKPKYEVTLKVEGEVYKEENVKEGKLLKEPKEPKREGYTFLGWYNGIEKFDFDEPIEEDITLTAKWEIKTYTVTWDTGTETVKEEVKYNEKVNTREDPTRVGYTFVGWYVNNAKFSFDTLIKNNTVIVAKWEKNTTASYKVEHYLMNTGGTYSSYPTETDTYEGQIGANVSISPKNYVGFTTPATKETIVNEDGSSAIRYYYERNKYTLKLNNTNEFIEELTGSGEFYYNEEVRIDAKVLTGYTFDGWSNGVKDKTYTFNMPAENLELTASAIPSTDTLVTLRKYLMDLNGEYKTYEEVTITGVTNEEVVIPKEEIEGFTYDKEEGGIVSPDGSTVVSVYYSRNKYNVEFNKTTGIEEVPESNEYYYGTSIDLTATLLEGYDFIKWTLLDGSTYSLENGLTLIVKEDLNLTAVAEKKKFNITFIDGENTIKEITKEYNDKLLEEEIPSLETKEGYTFLGWYNEEELFDINTNIKENITLKAKYKVNDNTIVFKVNNQVYKILTGEENTEINMIDNPVKEGYTFDGWYKDGELYDFSLNNKFTKEGIEVEARFVIIVEDIDNYIDGLIQESDMYNVSFNKETDVVEVELQNTELLFKDVLYLLDNVNNIINKEEVKDIVITYNDLVYTIDSVEKLNNLKEKINENYGSLKLSDYCYEKLSVLIELDEKIARTTDRKVKEEYSVILTNQYIIDKNLFSSFGEELLSIIENNNKDNSKYHITVDENVITLYATPTKTVLSTIQGSGVLTAMQRLLNLPYVENLKLNFENMDEVVVTASDITDENFEDFGMSLIPSFSKAIGKAEGRVATLKNSEIIGLEVSATLTLKEGYTISGNTLTNYVITFKSN